MSTSFVVKGLDKDKEYIFRVKAVNAQGHSPPSKVSEPAMPQDQPDRAGGQTEDDAETGNGSRAAEKRGKENNSPLESHPTQFLFLE